MPVSISQQYKPPESRGRVMSGQSYRNRGNSAADRQQKFNNSAARKAPEPYRASRVPSARNENNYSQIMRDQLESAKRARDENAKRFREESAKRYRD